MLNLQISFETKLIRGHKIRYYNDHCPQCRSLVSRRVHNLGKLCRKCTRLIVNREIIKNSFKYDQSISAKEKVLARAKTRRAIKSGLLQREACEVCGNSKSFPHHTNYQTPLKVMWLCKEHHQSVHRK